jgi:hypothetical protein
MQETTIYLGDHPPETIQRIEKLLAQTTGIERALADINDGEIMIKYDDKLIAKKEILHKIYNIDN